MMPNLLSLDEPVLSEPVSEMKVDEIKEEKVEDKMESFFNQNLLSLIEHPKIEEPDRGNENKEQSYQKKKDDEKEMGI